MTETLMTPEEYQRHVLLLLTAVLPEKYFEATDDPMVIAYQSARLGLDNLYTAYQRDQLTPQERDEHIEAHFSGILANLNVEGDVEVMTWAEAQTKVLLQPYGRQSPPDGPADSLPPHGGRGNRGGD
ncbi:MAG: hypothetical protein HC875_40785 [Anaerolineales bacterium]|nr:hypothetical protein [Anaerolineales bacterium]